MWWIIYIVVSFIIASYGAQRRIGFVIALFVSLLLSPLVGFMCVALSERKPRDGGDRHDRSESASRESSFDIEQFRSN